MKLTDKDIDKIVSDSIREQFCGITPLSFGNPIGNYFYKKNTIIEGLMKTYPIEQVENYMRKFLGFIGDYEPFMRKSKDEQGGEFLEYFIMDEWKNSNEIMEEIKQGMNLCGYFLSNERKVIFYKRPATYMQFEKKFGDNIVNVKENWSVIYHAASIYNVEKIKKIGLCPRSTNNYLVYPPRIYCFNGDATSDDIGDLIMQMDKYKNRDSSDILNPDKNHQDRRYVLFGIRTESLSKEIIFYKDQTYALGIFTYGNIPSKSIYEIGEIDCDKYGKK
jgi:hypothetical protein